MGRIRTIKPEFWEDEKVGMLSRNARLLFIATLNLADDEGLLRWTPAYIKASVFMYDDDMGIRDVNKLMDELVDSGVIFAYAGGVSHQKLALVVNFHKHQRINRPSPGKLPPPCLQNADVRAMYAQRDNWTCGLCGMQILPLNSNEVLNLSIDHIVPQSKGGSDYPSNVRATHQGCNKSRRNKPTESFKMPWSVSMSDPTESPDHSLNNSANGSMNETVNDSLPERKGKEQGTGKGMELPEGTKNVPSSSGEASPDDCGTDFEVAEQDGEALETPVGLFGEPAVTTGEKPQMAKALREVFSYYLTTMSRNPKTYTFSQLRRRKGMARLEEALRIAHGSLEDAIVLMKAVVDEVALSDWHMGRDPKTEGRTYCEWEDHLFRSTEQFEKWLQKTQEVSRKQGLGVRG